MAIQQPDPIGVDDPAILRQQEAAVAESLLIAEGAPVAVEETAIIPSALATASDTSVTIARSADSGDVVTITTTDGQVIVNSIDQTINNYKTYVGVANIVAGNNITVSSSSGNGTGTVTVNTTNTPTFTSVAMTVGYIAQINGTNPGNELIIQAGGSKNWNFGSNGNLTLPNNSSSINYPNGSPYGGGTSYGNSNVATFLSSYGSNTITTTGNVSVGNIIGNGQALTGIAGANVSGQVNYAAVANSVAVANVTGLGNIATINKDGNASNVLYGNGVFAAAPSGGGLPIANGTSNINIATSNGPVTLTSAGQTWTVGTDGSLTAPNNSNIYPAGNNFNVFTPPAGSVQFYSDGGNYSWSLDGFGVMNLPFASAMSNTALIYSPGNLRLDVGANNFMFTDTGTVVFPTMTVDLHNGGNQYAQTLQFGDDTQQAVITGPTPAANVNAQRLIIQGQRGNGTGEGGDVYFWAGDADTNGGDIKIYAGDADNVSTGSGGYINLDGGSGFDGGGQISVTGGYSTGGQGGPVYISAGQGANGGVVNITGGGASANAGGYVNIQGGFGQSDGGAVTIAGGGSALGLPGYGNVQITAGVSTWTFDNAGVLNLPGGTGTIESTANNINIYSDAGQLNGALFYDTGAEIYALQDFAIFTDNANASHIWRFYANGNMTAPGAINVGNMVIGTVPGDITADNNTTVAFNVTGSDGGFLVNYLDEVGNANTSGGELAFSSETGNATYRISLSDDLGNGFATKIWRFDGTGNLALAGGNSIIQSLPNNAGDGSGLSTLNLYPDASTGDDRYLIIDPTGPSHLHLRAGGVQDASNVLLYLGGEQTYVQVDDGYHRVTIGSYDIGNTTGYNWRFDYDGNLVLPLNTFAVKYANGTQVPIVSSASGSNNQIQFNSNGAFGASANYTFTDTVGGGSVEVGNELLLLGNGTISTSSNNLNIQPAGNLVVTASAYNWTFDTAGNLTLPGNTFAVNYANGSQASAPLVDVLNTNGLTTVFYPTFVENRTDGQIVRADVDLSYRSDTNTLTVGNIVANNLGNISSINIDGNVSNVLAGNGTFVALPVINANTVIWTSAPVANNSTGTAGQVAYDAGGNFYVCTATNTWSKFTGNITW